MEVAIHSLTVQLYTTHCWQVSQAEEHTNMELTDVVVNVGSPSRGDLEPVIPIIGEGGD
jgi:hypothetical protein